MRNTWFSFQASCVLVVLLRLGHASTLAAQSMGTFTPTGNMTTPRAGHTATLLLDGTVLVTSGTSAELYNPATGTFMPTGAMTKARSSHSATLLRDGRVLIAGGFTGFPPVEYDSTAELYNPATGIFTPTGNMVTPQAFHTGTLLENGKVLIAGGTNAMSDCCAIAARAEIYDPVTETFAETGNYADNGSSSVYGTAGLVAVPVTLLPNGQVLIAAEPAAELYDPATGTFTLTGTMATRPFGQIPGYIVGRTATLLKNGKVLLAGGEHEDLGIFDDAELYDPATGIFTETGHMTLPRYYHSATLLSDGKVLIAGAELYYGVPTSSAELYDPDSGTFSAIGNMTMPRYFHTATLLNSGQVLVAGGAVAYPGATSSAELYTPAVLGNVQVTVQTNPPGLQISVDGAMFTAPQNFSWSPSTNHTIAANSPQGAGGTRTVFANWSDSGAISHTVTPSANTTYTANFTTQYLLATSVSPAGGGAVGTTPSSADGYYDSGTSVQLSALANFGYAFTTWSGDLTGSTNPVLLVMSGPKNVAGNFNIAMPPRFVTDFNGDGKTDLVWQHMGTGQIATWLMDGTSLISAPFINPSQEPDTNWKIVGTGDFNADRKTDLVWQNNATGEVAVWFMDGTSLISAPYFNPSQEPDTTWKIVTVGDFNGDGKPDLVWQRDGTGEVAVWFMDGTSLISAPFLNPSQEPDTNWKIVGAGDFNGDGKPDLVWHNSLTGDIRVWWMNGINRTAEVAFNPSQVSDTNWTVAGVGDFNGDGRPDLIWQNDGTGEVAVWFMDGMSLISAPFLHPSQVSDLQWKIRNR